MNTYLDYNSTTPLLEEVKLAINKHIDVFANPASIHGMGRKANSLIESAKQDVKDFFKLNSTAEVVFNSGATESNNTILNCFKSSKDKILISAIEHQSIIESADNAITITVNKNGLIDIDCLISQLEQNQLKNILLCVIFLNNEIGVIQDLNKIIELKKIYNFYLYVDAAQAIGKINKDNICAINWNLIDAFCICGHKFGALKGIGALVVNNDFNYKALITGGGQEKGFRAGTQNLLGIVSLKHAIQSDFLNKAIDKCKQYQVTIEDFLKRLALKLKLDLIIFAQQVDRSFNTTSFCFKGITSQFLLINLDLKNIYVSAGAACSSSKLKPSHVIKALGYSDDIAKSAVRVSTGFNTTIQEVEYFLNTLEDILQNKLINNQMKG